MPQRKINKIVSDEEKHKIAERADEEILDEQSSLGHAPQDVEDIDQTLESVGLQSDENGPRELNSEAVIKEANKNH